MRILIKSVVCDRYKMAIQNVLDELSLNPQAVYLGEVDFGDATVDTKVLEQFQNKIALLGFEIINDKKTRLIEKIKKQVISLVQQRRQRKK